MLTERKVRILITSTLRVLGETVQRELEEVENLAVSFTTQTNLGLLAEIECEEADIVVFLDNDLEVPGVVSHIFDSYPGIIVVVFDPDSRDAILCQRKISEEPISKANLAELIKKISSSDNFNYWRIGHDLLS